MQLTTFLLLFIIPDTLSNHFSTFLFCFCFLHIIDQFPLHMLKYLKLILDQLNFPHPPIPTITSWDLIYNHFPSNTTELILSLPTSNIFILSQTFFGSLPLLNLTFQSYHHLGKSLSPHFFMVS